MSQLPEAFGMSVTVDNIDEASCFYENLYAHDRVTQGVFAGIRYISIMRNGETLVNIFAKGENNPLAPIFPTLKVDSVAAYEQKIQALGGRVLIPASTCPCTETLFAVCVDPHGNQFMVKEPRSH
jgi:predicted enzyme related to lactoylglutathione lyase